MTNRDDHAIGVSFHFVHPEILGHPADRPAPEFPLHAAYTAAAEVAPNATVAVVIDFSELVQPLFNQRRY